MSSFGDALAAAWPQMLAVFGESITHDPTTGDDYTATLIFDDSEGMVARKGGRVKAAICGPASSFTSTPIEGDGFVKSDGMVLRCVEVDEDRMGGYICWCRVESA